MTERTPDFDELVGDDVPAGERTRLERVHELLLQAGPPPELPVELAEPPAPPSARVIRLPRRRATWLAGVAAAAAVALGFGAGYLVGDRGPEVERTIAMQGAGASASLVVYAVDEAGNWPMRLSVTGLPAGATYELWLTKAGKLAAPCGRFTVGSGETEVPLNAPFRLKEFDGWVVVETGRTEPLLTT
jgi:hypothetical protein